ncbi:hypothetical protein G8A07_22220 [Roseateles sp. DAIF2]|uniref:hypothetical protein n=1 Tax=Roseateles sp. DAIF2 TaxID=2714952 RepID=UPI0018A31BD0|nr:hypothetical protein [Roseateles sp. DAIF2]QPF75366.1 hypothetical protein G8A07_22220 [Roseateles sp. DAIF2]
MKYAVARLLFGAGLALSLLNAQAAPVPSGLSITASVALDTANSLDPVGGASQSGSFFHSNGSPGSAGFSNLPGSMSPSSLSGALLQTGDSLGLSFSMSGSTNDGADVQTDGLFADYLLSLVNSSATDTFTLLFRVSARNAVQASGADAFAFSDLSVKDAGLNELFFSDYRADTLNPGSNFELQSLDDSFTIVLAPGQSTTLSALQRQRGGAFGDGAGSYGATLASSILLEEVRSSGGPNELPLPGSLPLALLGLLSGAWALRRHHPLP